MCHPEVPAGQPAPSVNRRELAIDVGGGERLPVLLTVPSGGPAPGVLLIPDIFGRTPFYEDLAVRLATAGFIAMLPEPYFRLGALPRRTRAAAMSRWRRQDERRSLEDLDACSAWLCEQPGSRGRVGTVGFCTGGSLALALTARRTDLVTVCYYAFLTPQPRPEADAAPAPMDLVDRMTGPIVGFWGDQDAGVSMEALVEFDRRMQGAGRDFRSVVYPGLGHGFLAASGLREGSDAYEQACESWTGAIEHLRRHLAPPAGARQAG